MSEEMLVVSFSIVQVADRRNAATLTYGMGEMGEMGLMKLKLQGVRFLDTSSGEFISVILGHTPPYRRYKRGSGIEFLFPGWGMAGYEVKDISDIDVSFERFWNLYGKKVGNKAGVAKKWEKLSWEERVMAIGVVPRMRRYYEKKGLDLPYPETYINQRRWENEFDN